jgi:hypothetical protein
MDAPLRKIIHQSELNIKRNYIPLGQTPKILKSIGVADLPMLLVCTAVIIGLLFLSTNSVNITKELAGA